MAIAFGSSGTPANGSSITGPTVSGTSTLGFAGWRDNAASDLVTSVTWGGASMTKIASLGFASNGKWVSLWYIVNPSSGATITQTGGTSTAGVAWYYTGAAQSGQPDSSGTHAVVSANTNPISTTVVAANCWYTSFNCDDVGSITYSVSTGAVRANASATGLYVADSSGTVATGSKTETWTAGAGTPNQGGILASFSPLIFRGTFLAFM